MSLKEVPACFSSHGWSGVFQRGEYPVWESILDQSDNKSLDARTLCVEYDMYQCFVCCAVVFPNEVGPPHKQRFRNTVSKA